MSDQFELDSLLKRMADDHQPQLPSPSLIWWRAQILRKQNEKARIERPMLMMRLIAFAVCFITFAGLLAVNWKQFQSDSYSLLIVLAILTGIISIVTVVVLLRSAPSQA